AAGIERLGVGVEGRLDGDDLAALDADVAQGAGGLVDELRVADDQIHVQLRLPIFTASSRRACMGASMARGKRWGSADAASSFFRAPSGSVQPAAASVSPSWAAVRAPTIALVTCCWSSTQR